MPRRLHCSPGSRSEEPDATKGGRPAVTLCSPKFGSNLEGSKRRPTWTKGWLADWMDGRMLNQQKTEDKSALMASGPCPADLVVLAHGMFWGKGGYR